MADTNGNVAPEHLTTYQGVQVSVAILPDLRACGDEVRQRGYTFAIFLPDGGYRSLATQVDMHVHPAAHNLLPSPPAPPLAPVGFSRHGFGRAVDIASNAPWPVLAQIAVKHHFTHWVSNDVPHWEWGNALVPADISSASLDNTSTSPKRRKTMTTLYNVGGTPTVALAGDSPGTPANWLETSAASLIASWQDAHGALNVVDAKTYAAWKAAYLTPLAISGGTSGPSIDLTHVASDLDAIEAAVKALKIPTKATIELS